MRLLERLVNIWKGEHPEEVLALPSTALARAGRGMHRRQFLKILGSSAAVAAAVPMMDLERLVWTLGEVVAVNTGNILLTADWITRETLRILKRNLQMVSRVHRSYDEAYRQESTVLLNPMADFDTPKFGTDTRDDWERHYRPQLEASASLRDAPLPMDALTREHVRILEPTGTRCESVVNMTGKMTVKLYTEADIPASVPTWPLRR